MAQEIGVAYVTLLPSARGFGKSVEKELDGAADGHEQKQKSLWSKVAQYGAVAAGIIGGLFTAKILTGGLSRALNIEDAQAKLKGLGHDTETVTGIMQNALAAVKGTAFGLDQAATIAASAVAAGIKPGQQLERYLKLTADAASIAGGSLSDLGRIFNNVTTVGAAYNDSLLNLAEKGLPIYQWLADEMGVSTAAVKKLASEGKVSSEVFLNAIEKNIAGAALAGGETTRGAFANMQAAMSRWGANLISGVLPFAHDFFSEMIVIFDGLNERTGGFVDRFNAWLSGINVDGFGERFLGWIDGLDFTAITDTYTAFKPLIDLVRDLSPVLLDVLGPALVSLRDGLSPVLPKLADALTNAVVELAPSIVDLLNAVIPLVPTLVNLAVKALPVVIAALEFLLPIVSDVVSELGGLFDGLNLVVGYLNGDINYGAFTDGIRGIGGALGDVYSQALTAGENIGSTVGTAFYRVQSFFQGVQQFVAGALGFVSDAWATLGKLIGDGLRVVVGMFTGNEDLVAEGMQGLQGRLSQIWESIVSQTVGATDGMWAQVTGAFNTGVAFVGSIPTRLVEFFKSLPTQFESIGRLIVQGLINGITGMAANAVRSVTSLSASMLSGMKNWLGIKSPSRVFRDQVGAQIAAGVIAGVDGMQVATQASIQSLVTVPQVDAGEGAGASIEINANGVDPMTTALLVKRELGALLAVH